MGKHEARDERLTTSFVMQDEYGKTINGPTDATGARRVRRAHSAVEGQEVSKDTGAKESHNVRNGIIIGLVAIGVLGLTAFGIDYIKTKKENNELKDPHNPKFHSDVQAGALPTEDQYYQSAGLPTVAPSANTQTSTPGSLPITTDFDTREVINDLLDKYNVPKDVRKFFTEGKSFERFKKFKCKEQLERVFPADIYTYKMTQLTKSDSKYRIPGEDNYLTEDEFDVICASIYLNNASAEDIYYIFGDNIPSAEEIVRGYVRYQYRNYAYWMRGEERIPIEYIMNDQNDIAFVDQFQEKMVGINKHSNTGKPFNVEQTDGFLNLVHQKYIEGGQSIEISEGAKNLASMTYQAFFMKLINASNMELLYIHVPEGTAIEGENLVQKDGPKSMWALLNDEPENANGISYGCLVVGEELTQNIQKAREIARNQNNDNIIDIETYCEERRESFGISSRADNDYQKLIAAEVENMFKKYAYTKVITPFRFTENPAKPARSNYNQNGNNNGKSTGGSTAGSNTTSSTETTTVKVDPSTLTGEDAAQAKAAQAAVANEVEVKPTELTQAQKDAIHNAVKDAIKNGVTDPNELKNLAQNTANGMGIKNFEVASADSDYYKVIKEEVAAENKQPEVKATKESEIAAHNDANATKSAENAATETNNQKTENDTNNDLINASLEVINAENQAFTDGTGSSYTDETGLNVDQTDPNRVMPGEVKVDWNPDNNTSKNESEDRIRRAAELLMLRRMATSAKVNSIPQKSITPTGTVGVNVKVFKPGFRKM